LKNLGRVWIGLLSMGWLSTLIAACAATSATGSGQTGTGGAGSAGTTGAGGAGSGAGGSSETFSAGVGGAGGGGCETHCSSDLHSVVDCNDKVITTCPADQGCGESGCVPACESAKQNKSTIGCDYYSVPPDTISEGEGACFAAYITNTWGAPISISSSAPGRATTSPPSRASPRARANRSPIPPCPMACSSRARSPSSSWPASGKTSSTAQEA
jgi:hypothetical protein